MTPRQLVEAAMAGFGSKTEFSRATGISVSTLNHFADGSNAGSRPLVVLLTILANHQASARYLCRCIENTKETAHGETI